MKKLAINGLGLIDMALDLRWSWNHAADKLWREVDPELWDRTGNPWLILQTVATDRLRVLAADTSFRKLVEDSMVEHREAVDAPAWGSIRPMQENPSVSPTSAWSTGSVKHCRFIREDLVF